MINPELFLKAAAIGVAIAAPVGPMSLLCMRRTLTGGWRPGLSIGLGVACGDATYASVAALGLAAISRFVLAFEKPIHLAAGIALLYLGLKTFSTAPQSNDAACRSRTGETRDLAMAYMLTLTNPPTIVMFAAVFTALAPKGALAPADAVTTVVGVSSGSLIWWIGVVTTVACFRHAIGHRLRRWIDRIAGAILAGFGAVELRRAA